MPQKFQLIYFNGQGRAEGIRLIFAQAGVQFEDVRFEPAELPNYKPKAPNGQFPIIDIDGKIYSQSTAIERYLAEQFGLHGKTPLDALRTDMIVDTIHDMLKPIADLFGEPKDEKMLAARKKFEEEDYPASLQKLEKMLISNNGGDGYFVGDQLTWADIHFFHSATYPTVPMVGAKVDLSKVPKLEALHERVRKEPRIAAYLEKRPECPF